MVAVLQTTFSDYIFLIWKSLYFDGNVTVISSQEFNEQCARVGWDGGLAPIRQQAINWTNDLDYWHTYVSLAGRSFRVTQDSYLWNAENAVSRQHVQFIFTSYLVTNSASVYCKWCVRKSLGTKSPALDKSR